MRLPDNTVCLSPVEIESLNKKLSLMRHDVNNQLALIVAAAELILRKPEMAQTLVGNIMQQPERIIAQVRAFSNDFESVLGITRDIPFSAPPAPVS